MHRSSHIRTALVLWCVAEALIFAVAVHLFGLGPVLLAEFATGLIGIALLRRTGAAALIKLRAAFQGRGGGADVLDGGLSILGALAVLLPGFLSDVVGLVLLSRPLRAGAANWLRRRSFVVARSAGPDEARARPSVIDLDPGEWRSGEGRGNVEIRP